MHVAAHIQKHTRQTGRLHGSPNRPGRFADSVDALSKTRHIYSQRTLRPDIMSWKTQMPLVEPSYFKKRLAIAIFERGRAKFFPAPPFAYCVIHSFILQSQFATAPHNSANRVVFEIFPDPAAQLHIILVEITPQQFATLQRRRQSRAVFRGLLPGMNPNGTQRISNVGKTTLFQEMKPHFKISHNEEAFIKPASTQSTTKHDRARSANQIALLEKTTINDSRSGNR